MSRDLRLVVLPIIYDRYFTFKWDELPTSSGEGCLPSTVVGEQESLLGFCDATWSEVLSL